MILHYVTLSSFQQFRYLFSIQFFPFFLLSFISYQLSLIDEIVRQQNLFMQFDLMCVVEYMPNVVNENDGYFLLQQSVFLVVVEVMCKTDLKIFNSMIV